MDYQYKTEPFEHQDELIRETAHLPYYGVLWEQGCGKTKPIIDNTALLYEEGEIDCLLVVAGEGVAINWLTDEVPTHMPDRVMGRTRMHCYQTRKAQTKWHRHACNQLLKHDGLAILTISYDAFMTKHGKDFIWKLLRQRRCFYVVDEGHNIKNPAAKRTKSIVASGKYAPFRRLLTGTPVGKGPFDIYSQVKFLDERFWSERRMGSFKAFKHHFGIWRTRAMVLAEEGYDPGYDQLIDYKNVDQLYEMLRSLSSRLTKDETLDLPPKLYSKRYFELTPEQDRVYQELRSEYIAELEGGEFIEAPLAIVRLLRLQQIACGYAQSDVEQPKQMIGEKNPRLDLCLEECEALGHKAIIWSRFTHDIDLLMDALGDRAVRYDGQVEPMQRDRNKQEFQRGDAEFFVANPMVGAEGLTLHAARTVIYYANSFSYIQRQQSEDRAHRIGQEHPVSYIDLVARGTVDEHIISSLRQTFDIASRITGDQLREWI